MCDASATCARAVWADEVMTMVKACGSENESKNAWICFKANFLIPSKFRLFELHSDEYPTNSSILYQLFITNVENNKLPVLWITRIQTQDKTKQPEFNTFQRLKILRNGLNYVYKPKHHTLYTHYKKKLTLSVSYLFTFTTAVYFVSTSRGGKPSLSSFHSQSTHSDAKIFKIIVLSTEK